MNVVIEWQIVMHTVYLFYCWARNLDFYDSIHGIFLEITSAFKKEILFLSYESLKAVLIICNWILSVVYFTLYFLTCLLLVISVNGIAFSMNSRPASVLEETKQRMSNDSLSLGKSDDRSGLIFILCRAVM